MGDMVIRAYKTELDPTNAQRTTMERFAWVRMAVFNTGLREWQRLHDAGEKTKANDIKTRFVADKNAGLFVWAQGAPSALVEAAFRDLDAAFQNFFRRDKAGEKPGYPKLKRWPQGFSLRNTRVERDRVRLTHIGWVRLKEAGYIPETATGKAFGTYATLSKRAGRWFISVLVKEEGPQLADPHPTVIGVDFGVKALATCSNGKVFDNPSPLRDAQRKLGRLGRELARRRKGGKNWNKTKASLQKQHKRVADLRSKTLHEVSHYLTYETQPAVLVIEDLNVRGMLSNHSLAQAITDVGFGELRRQIEYKAKWLGIEVVLADRWFPSSKTCHRCGAVRADLTLGDRLFVCNDCGSTLDRDLNAALNLAALGRNRQAGGDCLGS
jgi:putative transposase